MEVEPLDAVWKALSDPTRRRILDLLRRGPSTTGDLCKPFRTSRFAIMKHLSVLETAGLVLARRAGRERWNYLNSVPIQKIYERWVRGYESHWAESLIRLKTAVEQRETEATFMAEMSKSKRTGSLSIEQEVLIDAPRERVFKALTTEVEKWWAYRVHGKGTVVKLEPKLGGWFYEDSGKGEGAIWGTVIFFRRPEVLRLTGPLGMSGAVKSTYTYELVEKGR